jgi:hypothetical protein
MPEKMLFVMIYLKFCSVVLEKRKKKL